MARAIRAEDRLRSAALRAVGGDAGAELRGLQLVAADGASPVNSHYLNLLTGSHRGDGRGLADALAMIVRHNDASLHRSLRPTDPLERVVFDVLEQLRCQSLAPDLPGVRANLADVSDAWCRNARAQGVAESGVGLLVYTVTHMVRARLGLGHTDEEVDSIIEGPRARLAELLGHALAELAPQRFDQAAFAVPALEMARLIGEMAADTSLQSGEDGAARYRMLVPPEWIDTDDANEAAAATTLVGEETSVDALHQLGGYRIFTKAHDVVLGGGDLYAERVLRRSRSELDARIRAQAVSPQRIGRRLRRIFSTFTPTDWQFGEPEGLVDSRRLAQLVTTVDPQTLFRTPRMVRTNTTAVTILLDNSGSMKAHRFQTMAVLADTLARALDLAGVTNEVLGHTTNSWSGGAAMAEWRAAGKPADPGRVCELAQIVYKDADAPWRRARRSLASMYVTRHFRESVDGEAIIWAHQRLLARPEPRKILVVVSDGAPAESGTAMANGSPTYLTEHLARVVRRIEQRSPVELAAFSIGGAVDSVFANSTAVDLDHTLTIHDYAALERLFSRSLH